MAVDKTGELTFPVRQRARRQGNGFYSVGITGAQETGNYATGNGVYNLVQRMTNTPDFSMNLAFIPTAGVPNSRTGSPLLGGGYDPNAPLLKSGSTRYQAGQVLYRTVNLRREVALRVLAPVGDTIDNAALSAALSSLTPYPVAVTLGVAVKGRTYEIYRAGGRGGGRT